MPRLLIFIRYERRFPILILIFNHYFIWQSKHNDDSQYHDSISAPAAGTSPLTFSLFLSSRKGEKNRNLETEQALRILLGTNTEVINPLPPYKKLWWIVGCDLGLLKKKLVFKVQVVSKVVTVLAEVIYYLYKAGQCYGRAGLPISSHILTLTTAWEGNGKSVNIHWPSCISPGMGKQAKWNT